MDIQPNEVERLLDTLVKNNFVFYDSLQNNILLPKTKLMKIIAKMLEKVEIC